MPWDLTGNSGIDPNSNFLGTIDAEPLIIKTNNVEALRIHPGGSGAAARVGIGTTEDPGAILEIVSDGIKSDPLRLRATNPDSPRSFRLGPDVGANGIFGIYDDQAKQTRLAIAFSGTVGIGTQTPDSDYALHVHETRANHSSGILAVSETGAGLAAVTQSPNFYALAAENRQGSAINALGSDSDRNSVGVTGQGFTGVSGQSAAGTGVLGVTSSVQSPEHYWYGSSWCVS